MILGHWSCASIDPNLRVCIHSKMWVCSMLMLTNMTAALDGLYREQFRGSSMAFSLLNSCFYSFPGLCKNQVNAAGREASVISHWAPFGKVRPKHSLFISFPRSRNFGRSRS